eukprot:scaffold33646_cov75-Phaeocystis_antarctica.AAC.1
MPLAKVNCRGRASCPRATAPRTRRLWRSCTCRARASHPRATLALIGVAVSVAQLAVPVVAAGLVLALVHVATGLDHRAW